MGPFWCQKSLLHVEHILNWAPFLFFVCDSSSLLQVMRLRFGCAVRDDHKRVSPRRRLRCWDFSGLLSSCSWIAFCVLQLNAYPHGQVFVRHAHLCLAHLPWPGDRPMLAAFTRLYHMHWAPDDGVVTIVKANCEMVLSRLLCHNQRLEHNNRNYIGETSAEQRWVYILNRNCIGETYFMQCRVYMLVFFSWWVIFSA